MASKKGKAAGSTKVPLPKLPVTALAMRLTPAGTGYLPGNVVRFGPVSAAERIGIHVLAVAPVTGAITLYSVTDFGEFHTYPKQPLQQTFTDGPGLGAGLTVTWKTYVP